MFLMKKSFARKGILVIDDDPIFGRLITGAAEQHEIPIKFYQSLEQLGTVGRLREYDVAILDYFLDHMNGLEVAAYIDAFCPGTPVILTSGETFLDLNGSNIPRCIRDFVSKARGARSILKRAMNAIHEHPCL